MKLRVVCIVMLLGLLGASAHAVPAAAQTVSTEPAAVAPDPGGARGDDRSQARRKNMRRCARRSRLGICERWNMPKSTVPAPMLPDSRNPPTKH